MCELNFRQRSLDMGDLLGPEGPTALGIISIEIQSHQ